MAEEFNDPPEELLPVHFVQLAHDILDCVLQTRYYYVLDSVDSAIGRPNHFVKNCECRLEGC